MMRLTRRGVIAAAGALPLFGGSLARAAEPTRIRMAYVVAGANLASILFDAPGTAKHLGKSYRMEAVHFTGTPEMITALATGDIEIATLAYSSFALAIENARMTDLRVIADEFQ